MTTRPSLRFGDDDPQADALDLSAFRPKPVSRPNQQQVAQAAAKANFKSREPKPVPEAAPAKVSRRRRTGRSAQLNLKVRQDTIDSFYAIADAQGWVLGEAFEKAVDLLGKHCLEQK